MKLNVSSYSYGIQNAYYETCTWELQRHEILNKIICPHPHGRGQLIAVYLANLGAEWRNKLPQPITPVPYDPNTLELLDQEIQNTMENEDTTTLINAIPIKFKESIKKGKDLY